MTEQEQYPQQENNENLFPERKNWWTIVKAHPKLVSLSVLAVLLITYFIYLISGLPSLKQLENIDPPLVTRIYSEDGKLVHELFRANRVYVPYERIPDHTIQALIATEDRKFYDHWGIDIRRIPKVVLVNLFSMSFRQGFSTITMQLSRNLYFDFKKTISRKFREILTSLQIERTYSKQEILQMYFTVSYFGHGVYGIQAAAKKYFDKDAMDLNVEESATLISLLKSPAYYSPITHPDRALNRRNLVLRNMKTVGYLTQAEYDSLSQLDIKVREFEEHGKIAPYFTEQVRQEMNVLGDSLNVNVYEDGLNVYTTLNSEIQTCMDSSVQEFLPELQARVKRKLQPWKEKKEMPDSVFEEKAKVQIAFVALNHHNGHIMAMVGGRDFKESKFNRAVQARRQPGSAFKPFLYTAAMDNGYTTIDKFMNQPVVVTNPDGTRWDPENYGKTFGGLTTLRDGLRKSINLVAVRLIQEVEPPVVADYAHRMGISTPLRPFPTLALGSSEVIPLELVSAYGVFANQGVRVKPQMITRVEDRFGNVIYQSKIERSQILSRATAYIMTDLLQSVINNGTGGRARWKFNFYKTAAGKTGTTNNFTDAWFVGFTPSLTAGVWVGLDDPQLSLGPGESGAIAALPFWADFMKCVDDSLNLPTESFKQPPDIVRLEVCEDSGKLATDYCPRVIEEVFNAKYHPTESCDLHRGPDPSDKKNRVLF